jgi:hypothetical protein
MMMYVCTRSRKVVMMIRIIADLCVSECNVCQGSIEAIDG